MFLLRVVLAVRLCYTLFVHLSLFAIIEYICFFIVVIVVQLISCNCCSIYQLFHIETYYIALQCVYIVIFFLELLPTCLSTFPIVFQLF